MKKSTLLFIIGNILVLLTPLVFMVGLRFKINNGEVVDIKAEHDAQTKKAKVSEIENVEVNGTNKLVSLFIYRDSINEITMDTSDYKYLSYKITGKTLVVNYDYVKDSIENYIQKKKGNKSESEESEPDTYKGQIRSMKLFMTSGLRSIKLKNSTATIYLSKRWPLDNDIEIMEDYSSFEFAKSQDGNNYNYNYDEESYVSDYDATRVHEAPDWDSIPYRVKVFLKDSDIDTELSYVKTLEIEARNSAIRTHDINFNRYDLKLDEYSTTYVDISKLRKMNITYIK